MRPGCLAGTALTPVVARPNAIFFRGMTLIELVVVVSIIAILLVVAVPSYRNYTLRVHRTEAIRLLLQASMCQERIHANEGSYDTDLCQPVSGQQRYQLEYKSPDPKGIGYVVVAIPKGAQFADPCGSLSLDQNGARSISAENMSAVKCWNGR